MLTFLKYAISLNYANHPTVLDGEMQLQNFQVRFPVVILVVILGMEWLRVSRRTKQQHLWFEGGEGGMKPTIENLISKPGDLKLREENAGNAPFSKLSDWAGNVGTLLS